MRRIYDFFGGRHTFFVFWFFTIGCILAFIGKLTANYIAMAGGLQTLIMLRAVSEDRKEISKTDG
jgi:hypothetical protein